MSDDEGQLPVERIVSGGQTGVDRAALDVAIQLGIEHGGWCPRGQLAEDGPIPPRYQLTEIDSAEYWVRTERNVVDSQGTLILYGGELTGGTELTLRMAVKHDKPHLTVDLQARPSPQMARQWILKHNLHHLNVAGPRESSAPGIGQSARQFLLAVFFK